MNHQSSYLLTRTQTGPSYLRYPPRQLGPVLDEVLDHLQRGQQPHAVLHTLLNLTEPATVDHSSQLAVFDIDIFGKSK